MTGVEIVSALVLILFLVAVITLCVYDFTGVNIIKRAWDNICNAATWRPKTGIDKEIEEAEKEISELEKHKEKVEKLERLNKRRDRLFKDVHMNEYSSPTKAEEESKEDIEDE